MGRISMALKTNPIPLSSPRTVADFQAAHKRCWQKMSTVSGQDEEAAETFFELGWSNVESAAQTPIQSPRDALAAVDYLIENLLEDHPDGEIDLDKCEITRLKLLRSLRSHLSAVQ